MRHFDTWVLRDPYSIWHYYPTGHRWRDTVRDLIQSRSICSPDHTLNPPIDPWRYPNPVTPQDQLYPSQSQSPLLCLPAELRHIIWSYVLTDSPSPTNTTPQTLHLVQLKGKIRHVRCPAHSHPHSTNANSLTQNRHCCPTTPARWRIYDGRVPGHSDRLLYPHTHSHLPEGLSNANVALLRVCRSIYAEAEKILYKSSHFDVDDLYTFIAFSKSISATARDSITRLTVQWMPVWVPMAGAEHKGSIYAHTHSDELWVGFWEAVCRLEGLRELGVSLDLGRFTGVVNGNGDGGIGVSGKRMPFGMEVPWVQPLLEVRGLREFELAVTARCDAAVRGVVEGELVREVGELRDGLRAVLCRPRERGKIRELKRRRGRLAITAG